MLAAARWLQGNSSGLGKGGRCAILAAFILFSAFNMGERSWNTFHPFVINDIVTTIYAQYARNLVRYPLSETRGLMVDLVGAPPSGLTLGEPTTVYTDHPSGTVWLIAVVHRFLVNDPIMAARLTNIIAAIGTGVVILAFVYRRTSLWPAVGATIVLLTLPLFWEHSIVANFEPIALFFMVAAATSFVRYREQPGYGRLVATALLWIGGMLCDWPAYFLGAPFAAALIYRRQWGLLVLFTALGFGTMGAVFGQLMLGPAAFSPTGLFYGTHSALLTEPFGLSMSRAFGFVVRGFALWRWWLVLPFVPIVWRGNASTHMKELQFLFLSFLFVGIANDTLFYSWKGEHSFLELLSDPGGLLRSGVEHSMAVGQSIRVPVDRHGVSSGRDCAVCDRYDFMQCRNQGLDQAAFLKTAVVCRDARRAPFGGHARPRQRHPDRTLLRVLAPA